MYVITEEGEPYLNEEYDAETGAYINGEENGEPSAGAEPTNG